jgi:WD40 repeat protein
MEKDRNRRYESASALAADVQRYLDDEPVLARPPSAGYRLQKYARRHKGILTAMTLVAMALLIGTGVSLWQARRAIKSEDRAIKSGQLAVQRFFEADKQRQNAEHAAKLAQQNEEFSRQLVYAADVKLAAQAWQSGDVRRFTDLLDRHTQIVDKTDRRGFEWWYLRQFGMADFRNIATQTGGSCVARHSPDGKYLATARDDGTICVWDGGRYRQLMTLRGHEGLVRGVDFTADGSRLASTGYDGMIRLWDLSRGKEIRAFEAYDGHGSQVFFALSGTILVSHGEEPVVTLWDGFTDEVLGILEGYDDDIRALDVSPDRRFCVAASEGGGASVWDLQSRKSVCELSAHDRSAWARCFRFSPDGRMVAGGTKDKLVRIWDSRTGMLVATFYGHVDDIQDVAFHPSGGLLASSDKAGVIRLWPLNSLGEVVDHDFGTMDTWPPYFQAHSARAWSLDFSPDGSRLISASKDGNVRSWTSRKRTRQDIGETDDTNAITFVDGGNELFIAGNNSIHIWDRQADEIRQIGAAFNESAQCVAVSPDGETCFTGHLEGIIRVWNCETGGLKKKLTGHEDTVDRIVFSPDGRLLATAGRDGMAKLWDAASAKQLAVFEMPPHCYDVAFSPNGRLLACWSEDDAMLFDVRSQIQLQLLQGHQSSAQCVTFSPDGRLLATGSHDRTIRLWNVATGEVKHVIAAHREKIASLAFSPDGRTIASGDDTGTISFSHVETGQFLFDTKVGNGEVCSLEFSPDGEILAATVFEEGVVLLHAGPIDHGIASQDVDENWDETVGNDAPIWSIYGVGEIGGPASISGTNSVDEGSIYTLYLHARDPQRWVPPIHF